MMDETPIASFSFVNERNNERAEDAISICPKQEIVLGCKHVQQYVNDRDPTISRRHLMLRCVQFDEDAARWNVAPMVYVEDLSMNGTILVREYPDEGGSTVQFDHQLTKSMGPVLLQDGDCLYLSNSTYVQYRELDPKQENEDDISFVTSCEAQRFEESFKLVPRLIGAGGQGKVFVAWDKAACQQVACKVVPLAGANLDRQSVREASQISVGEATAQYTPSRKSKVQSAKLLRKIHHLEVEYDILKDLNHPNIIDMRRVFITTHHIYIMQELMAGGDLFSFIFYKGGVLGDALSAVITLQILKAVECLHNNGIAHRDIKPENILMTSWKDGARIVLTDFGLAKRIGRYGASTSQYGVRSRMFTTCGTHGFAAPEVHKLNPTIAENKGYSSAIDMWSVGTVAALMLTGNLAFDHRGSEGEIGQVAARSHSAYDLSIIDQGKQAWEKVPKRARNFVTSLLVLQEDKRLTATEALQHSWFTNKICAASFDALYNKAISDWKPRTTPKEDIVVSIDTSDIAIPTPSASQNVRRESESTIIKSQFFSKDALQEDPLDQVDEHPDSNQDLQNIDASPASQTNTDYFPSFKPPPSTATPLENSHPDTSTRFDRPPESSDPDNDLDRLEPSLQLRNMQPSMEFTWPSSPPHSRKRRLPSFEFSWPEPSRVRP